MDLKEIQQKLKELRDRIRAEGHISTSSEQTLRDILNTTLVTANDELSSLQEKLSDSLSKRAGNDNVLSEEQKKRLSIIEKTGSGSQSVH